MNFSNGVIFGESIVIVAMKVQYTGLKFVDGESLKEKGFIPSWVKSSSFDFGFQSMFLIWEKCDSNIGVAEAISVARFYPDPDLF